MLLIAAGAAGGVAATFNTPIGGVTFAVELILPVVTATSMLFVGLSSVIATSIGRLFLGSSPAFDVPSLSPSHVPDLAVAALPWFALFGVAVGVLAWALTRGVYWFEDRFNRMPGNYYTHHMSGMLVAGVILYAFMTLSKRAFGQPDHYYVEGVGYAAIMDILRGDLTAPGFLLLLAAAKLLMTCLALGSGASGGVFSPSVFLGAALGAAFGDALQSIFPGLAASSALSPAHFANAGMAGMVSGTTGAVITGTIMIFEMTRDYTVIMPVILTVALAAAVRNWLSPETIYTLKLVRRGETVPLGLQARMAAPRDATRKGPMESG